jgi:hypothetical protein
MIVPQKTIAVIPVIEDEDAHPFPMSDLSSFIRPLTKKREWFSSDFYKCLPLSIGNMQGFIFSLPFEFDVFWNGGDNISDLSFNFYEDVKEFKKTRHVRVKSHFGYGILTISIPVILKTPPGINLMTIAPPNFPTPGLSAMTGVIESDNLKYTFSLNIKVDLENTWIKILPNYPLMGIIPIPRYFCDSFNLVNAYDLFEKEVVEKERIIAKEHEVVRDFLINKNINKGWDRTYFTGSDIRGTKFSDHQLPNKKK